MQVAVTSPADDAARGGFRVVAELARPTRVEFHNFAVNGDLKTAVAAQCAPGMLLAVLGPAATREQRTASQVMDALRGLQVGRLSVDVVLNGAATTMRTFRKCTGYAPREYFPYEFCTALEAFEFAARLRLPASVPWSQRRTLVDDVLNSLGLGSARMVSHMSPLERRKVVLGVEMCARVRALIMDEPLEGLCARDGVALLAALQAYAAASQTPCIFSITSVPSQTFLGLDRLLVLTGTFQRVFAGRAADLDAALAAAGLVVPARVSPGDFIVDCLAFISDDDLVVGKAGVAAGVDDPGPMAEAAEAGVDAPRAGVVEQFALILVRDAKGMVREKTQIVGRFASMLFIALLVDLVFQNQGDQSRSSYSPGSHFASMAMTCMFASVVSLLTTVRCCSAAVAAAANRSTHETARAGANRRRRPARRSARARLRDVRHGAAPFGAHARGAARVLRAGSHVRGRCEMGRAVECLARVFRGPALCPLRGSRGARLRGKLCVVVRPLQLTDPQSWCI